MYPAPGIWSFRMDEKESTKLKTLSDIASIDISLEFNEILHNILKITCETMNAHSGTIMLVDEDTDELKMVSSYGLPENYIENVYASAKKAGVHLTSSPSGAVLRTGKYYAVSNLFKEPKARPWYHLGRDLGITAQIFTPMKRGLKVIGLLNVYMSEIHDFTDEEINFVTVAASQASSVVQNARMCIRLKNNIDELKDYKEQLEDGIKQTHAKLFESEKYLRTIIESSLDGILVLDSMGRFEFGNASAINILCWPREELIGHFFMKVIPKDMSEFMMERWLEVQNGMGKPYETKIITKNHEIRYLYVSHTPTLIHGKKKYVVVIEDISEEKKLEICLKESEAKYRDLFENAEDPMYTLDMNGTFLAMNNVGLNALRTTKDEIIGSNISEWLTPESLEIARNRLKKNCEGIYLGPMVYEMVRKDGEHIWVEVKNRFIRDGERITRTHGIARDVTEKKRLEQELKESEAKYRDLFENAEDPMYTLDTQGFFKTINKSGLKILGATEEVIIGSHISQWITPESLKRSQMILARQINGEIWEQPIVIEVVTKNGTHKFGEVKTRLLKDGNQVIGIHGVVRDITEKIKIEQKLLESELKYCDLFENAQDPMFVVDTTGHFLKMNKA
jgi:PAS domain S-box-containing protein